MATPSPSIEVSTSGSVVPTSPGDLRRWLSLFTKPALHRTLSCPFDVVHPHTRNRVEFWVEGLVHTCGIGPILCVYSVLLCPHHVLTIAVSSHFPPDAVSAMLADDPIHAQFLRLVSASSDTSSRAFASQIEVLRGVVDAVFALLHIQPPDRDPEPHSVILMRCEGGTDDVAPPPLQVVTFSSARTIYPHVAAGDLVRVLVHLDIRVLRGSSDGVPRPSVFLSFDRVERLATSREAQAVCDPHIP